MGIYPMNQVSENGSKDKDAIFQEWLEAMRKTTTTTINGKELTIIYEMVDVMPILIGGDVSNPLLAAIQSSMQQKQPAAIDMTKPEILSKLSEVADQVAILAIVAPPLLEQGNDPGISVSRIPFTTKMEIFMDLMGLNGEVKGLENFRSQPSQSPVTRPKS